MSSRRTLKTPGWAAFDLKQQQQQKQITQITEPAADKEPYPPISTNTAPRNIANTNHLSGGSFSSVIRRSASVPNFSTEVTSPAHFGTSNSNHDKENVALQFNQKLIELHPWADRDLIADIMAAVGNDIDKASALLESMRSVGRSVEKKETTQVKDSAPDMEQVNLHTNSLPANTGSHLRETTHASEGGLIPEENQPLGGHVSLGNLLPNGSTDLELILERLRSVPVEPEWEEDDVYLIHRRDAIRMMRSASRHSKAANDAYLRGDHSSARELSLKAQEEWSATEKLNLKAAKEIFTIRNKTNEWKLDLHGLHAAEAVQFLSEHLEKIESHVPVTYSENPNIENIEMGPTHVTSLDYSSSVELERRSNRQQQSYRQKLLEVITGKGNHSRGQAAIPIAVRNFLNEKGYHYFEPRDGVIKVHPKFHRM